MSLRLALGPIMQQVGGGSWTPAQLDGSTGLRWYKADDAATISDTGGLVDSFADKFSGGYDLTGSSTTRPTTGTVTLNSKNVLSFAADYLTAASAADWTFMHNGSTYLVSMLVNVSPSNANPGATYTLYGNNGTSTGSRGTALYFDDQARDETVVHQVTRGVGGTYAVQAVPTNGMVPPSKWMILTVLCDPDNATASLRSSIFVNRGLRRRDNAQTGTASASAPTYAWQLGAGGNNVFPATMYFAEMVITSDWADRHNIESYFSREWSLNLPYELDTSTPVTVAA